jgi:cell division septation protein DedD
LRGDRKSGGRKSGRHIGQAFLLLVILLPVMRLQAQEVSPLTTALRLAQDGRIDSARATLKRMEQSTVPTDTLFPGILYSSALVAPTAEEVRRQLQRVIVEYPFSPWAEPAMIALAQLDYANGDPAAAARTLEKFRTDHATSSLYTVAALWGARAGFDVNDPRAACQWVGDGLAREGGDASARAELLALSRRCSTAAPATAAPAPAPAPAAPVTTVPPAAPDTIVRPARDSVIRLAEIPQPPGPIPVLPRPAPTTAAAPAAYRVQIVAANSQEAADEMLDRAKKAGFKGIIVRDGGYFKVRLGEYATRGEAAAAAAKVKAKLGGSPFVVVP